MAGSWLCVWLALGLSAQTNAPVAQRGIPGTVAKLYFRYGAMNSGKSTALLQAAFNYEERNQQVLLANLDQVVLVFASARPEPHLGMLDRFLVITEKQKIPALIVVLGVIVFPWLFTIWMSLNEW